jgi:hypothetical protein
MNAVPAASIGQAHGREIEEAEGRVARGGQLVRHDDVWGRADEREEAAQQRAHGERQEQQRRAQPRVPRHRHGHGQHHGYRPRGAHEPGQRAGPQHDDQRQPGPAPAGKPPEPLAEPPGHARPEDAAPHDEQRRDHDHDGVRETRQRLGQRHQAREGEGEEREEGDEVEAEPVAHEESDGHAQDDEDCGDLARHDPLRLRESKRPHSSICGAAPPPAAGRAECELHSCTRSTSDERNPHSYGPI